MPTAPYLPVARAPQDSTTPSVRLDVPGAAFGTATADALSHLGKVEQQVGDEIYARAKALQDLKNDAEAKEADAAYMIRAGELHAQYNSLQGKDAVDSYPKYMEDLEKARIEIGSNLSNDMARKMYDGASRSTMSRTIFNGAGHAATQQKRYTLGANQARIDATISDAASNPLDDLAFGRATGKLVEDIKEQAVIAGWSEDETNHKVNAALSSRWSTRIASLARTQPFLARKMLDENRDKILGQDQEKVNKIVQDQLRTVGGRNISDAVNQGWAPYMKQAEIDRSQGVESALIQVVKRAQQISEVPFTIGGEGGRRTPEQQARLVQLGRSQTLNSDHLGGRAIDLVPLIDGQPNYKDHTGYDKIAAAMQKASEELGIPLKPKSKAFTGWDPAHYALGGEYNVASAPKPKEEPLQSRIDRAKDYAKTLAPEDSVFADYVGERVMTDFTRAKAIQRDRDLTNINTINGAILGAFGGEKLPTTIEELKATSPEVAMAWDDLDSTKQKRFLSYLAQNAKGDIPWSPEGLRRSQLLKGMAQSDPVAFMDVDVLAEKIPIAERQRLSNLQIKLKAKAESDPRVVRALQVLGPDLRAAGISRQQDPDEFFRFVGALQDALTEWQGESKRVPTDEDRKMIGAQLLQEQSASWFLNPWGKGQSVIMPWSTGERFYKIPVPPQKAEEIRADPRWGQLGITPTDEQIQRVYTRRQYQEIYGGTASAPKPPMSK